MAVNQSLISLSFGFFSLNPATDKASFANYKFAYNCKPLLLLLLLLGFGDLEICFGSQSAYSVFTEPQIQSSTLNKLSTLAYACNPISGEVEAGGSEFQSHLQLHRKFKTNWSYMSQCLKCAHRKGGFYIGRELFRTPT